MLHANGAFLSLEMHLTAAYLFAFALALTSKVVPVSLLFRFVLIRWEGFFDIPY